MRDLEDRARAIARAATEVIDERLSTATVAQLERWYEKDEDDVWKQKKEVFEHNGHRFEVPVAGLQRPSGFKIEKVTIHYDSQNESEYEIEMELGSTIPPEGITALHKAAVKETKEKLSRVPPDIVIDKGETDGE